MFYFRIFHFLLIFGIISANIQRTIHDYFKSPTFKSFQKDWQKHRKAYENAIKLALQDNYGYKGMNVYIRKSADAHRIANGFYLSDGVVGLVFQDMFMGELPHLSSPEVTLTLASNALRVESRIDKIIIDTRYTVLRNRSDLVYGSPDNKNSPFTYNMVERNGNLAIIADNCKLRGYAITKLSGQSLDIGHNTFRVSSCKFSVEISSPGLDREPVTAQYFNPKQSRALEKLISKPIREELLPKLQGSLLTYINTTLIFPDNLSKYRQQQYKIFKRSSKYIHTLIRNLNKNSLQLNRATAKLKPLQITWNYSTAKPCDINVEIKPVTIYGLDSVFSAHRGGPYNLQYEKIGEAITFNYVQVRGKIQFENETLKSSHKFSVEINDITFNIEIDLKKNIQNISFVEWRSSELSIMDYKGNAEERMNANSFIIGYLHNVIPKTLINYLHKIQKGKAINDKLYDMSYEDYDYSSTSFESDNYDNYEMEKVHNEMFGSEKNSILLSLHKPNNNAEEITPTSNENGGKDVKNSKGSSESEMPREADGSSQERKKKVI